jgi:hypothetical protein
MTVREAQRVFLELEALLDFEDIYRPRMALPSASFHASSNLIGGFTMDVNVCDNLFRAGNPVWLVRPYITLHSVRVRALAPLQTADRIVSLDPPSGLPQCTLYSGPANKLEKYAAIVWHIHQILHPDDEVASLGSPSPRTNLPPSVRMLSPEPPFLPPASTLRSVLDTVPLMGPSSEHSHAMPQPARVQSPESQSTMETKLVMASQDERREPTVNNSALGSTPACNKGLHRSTTKPFLLSPFLRVDGLPLRTEWLYFLVESSFSSMLTRRVNVVRFLRTDSKGECSFLLQLASESHALQARCFLVHPVYANTSFLGCSFVTEGEFKEALLSATRMESLGGLEHEIAVEPERGRCSASPSHQDARGRSRTRNDELSAPRNEWRYPVRSRSHSRSRSHTLERSLSPAPLARRLRSPSIGHISRHPPRTLHHHSPLQGRGHSTPDPQIGPCQCQNKCNFNPLRRPSRMDVTLDERITDRPRPRGKRSGVRHRKIGEVPGPSTCPGYRRHR